MSVDDIVTVITDAVTVELGSGILYSEHRRVE